MGELVEIAGALLILTGFFQMTPLQNAPSFLWIFLGHPPAMAIVWGFLIGLIIVGVGKSMKVRGRST